MSVFDWLGIGDGNSMPQKPKSGSQAVRDIRDKRAVLRERVVVDHAIGRIKNLGAGRARYIGRTKTKTQWLWSAVVANLSLIWGKQGFVNA